MAPDLFSAPFAQLLSEVAMPTRSIRSCAVFEKNEIEFHRGRLELVRLPGTVPKLSTRIFGPITVSSSQDVFLTPCSKTRFLSNFSAADCWRFHITARAHRGRWCQCCQAARISQSYVLFSVITFSIQLFSRPRRYKIACPRLVTDAHSVRHN